jgi:ABC-type bacteriocin/lantibiotic exporter with double-glycine peptidase domain
LERIESYLSSPNRNLGPHRSLGISESQQENHSKASVLSFSTKEKLLDNFLVFFEDVDIACSSKSALVLRNLNLTIQRGITLIIGPAGAGKSTLIGTILGETLIAKGVAHIPLSNVGYCAQTPWLTNDTIRQNIIGGSPIDDEWYHVCLSMAALEQDLETLPGGDMHRTGSSGIGLSGGQKKRVVSMLTSR